MKSTVYIESSVVSYLAARPSRDVIVAARQAVTRDWWDNHRSRFELSVSQLVESEIRGGDPEAAIGKPAGDSETKHFRRGEVRRQETAREWGSTSG